jgi:hypothetical protein
MDSGSNDPRLELTIVEVQPGACERAARLVEGIDQGQGDARFSHGITLVLDFKPLKLKSSSVGLRFT